MCACVCKSRGCIRASLCAFTCDKLLCTHVCTGMKCQRHYGPFVLCACMYVCAHVYTCPGLRIQADLPCCGDAAYTAHTCCIHSTYMLHTQHIHVAYTAHTCCIHSTYMLHTQHIHVAYTAHTCCIHSTYMLHCLTRTRALDAEQAVELDDRAQREHHEVHGRRIQRLGVRQCQM